MADLKGGNKKRLTINLSLFASNDHNSENYPTKSTNKSPKSFEPNGVVGLGIVAAMNEMDQTHDPFFSAKSSRAAILALSPRSTPIPILNKNTIRASNFVEPKLEEKEEDMELCEEYTCVISHIGNNLIRKREYFDDVLANESESSVNCGVFSAYDAVVEVKEPVVVFRTADFLNSCYLCKKQLQGLDIFMYRGEKAFCSAECRCKQIAMDERKEKCGSGAMKSLEYSVSPCSGPMQFLAGVAAA